MLALYKSRNGVMVLAVPTRCVFVSSLRSYSLRSKWKMKIVSRVDLNGLEDDWMMSIWREKSDGHALVDSKCIVHSTRIKLKNEQNEGDFEHVPMAPEC